jgi:hypothetical protein
LTIDWILLDIDWLKAAEQQEIGVKTPATVAFQRYPLLF